MLDAMSGAMLSGRLAIRAPHLCKAQIVASSPLPFQCVAPRQPRDGHTIYRLSAMEARNRR